MARCHVVAVAIGVAACGQPMSGSQTSAIAGSGSGMVDAPVEVDAMIGSDAPDGGVVVEDAGVPGDASTCTGDCSSCTPDGCPCVARDIYVEFVDFDADTIALPPGGYAQVSAMAQLSDGNYVPASGLMWSSSDPDIAIVTPYGLVMTSPSQVDGATVTITATTFDGTISTSLTVTISSSGSGSGSGTHAPT